ncbi:MAG: glycosyl hydrolase family 32 [Acidobacteria bacterium]|nr:glycosyl hydrolase family 32 [Acidobacteriota bacterium]
MPVPYLRTPPDVIPIDVGRQLFVDDFLIDKTDLRRQFHAAEYSPSNPVLRPDRPWEQVNYPLIDNPKLQGPAAQPFSDGVWWDPKARLFKIWYLCGSPFYTCFATSKDGLRWNKPTLDVKPGTNIVQARLGHSSTIWLDDDDPDPKRRFKRFAPRFYGLSGLAFFHSPDGIHWSDVVNRSEGSAGDRSTMFYNPFRKVWVASLRSTEGIVLEPITAVDTMIGRRRYYHEGRTPEQAPDLKVRPQLYTLDAVAYESIMLSLFTIWRGQPLDRPKPNELLTAFSRDGFFWDRPSREVFIPVSERHGDWNWGNVQSAGGICLVVGDRLYFYVSGNSGVKGTMTSGLSQTGLATLRRDGFASMESSEQEGTLTTRPVRFQGKRLFVNVAARSGELRVEVLDREGNVIAPLSRDKCDPVRTDTTIGEVRWKGAADLSALAGKPVRFRFFLKRGALYAFWVSPDSSGASHGYVAAGGPGFTGSVDTVGIGAYGRRK